MFRTVRRSATNARPSDWRVSGSGARRIEAGCMVATDKRRQTRSFERLTAPLRHAELRAEQGLRRCRAEHDDDPRLDQLERGRSLGSRAPRRPAIRASRPAAQKASHPTSGTVQRSRRGVTAKSWPRWRRRSHRVTATALRLPVPNRLAGETSPYLLQHAHNPVDWYPWGARRSRGRATEDKPILLSIGYSACHWCHVMERESFEDPHIAALMNEHVRQHQGRSRGAARPGRASTCRPCRR